jgi:hypothetical protein
MLRTLVLASAFVAMLTGAAQAHPMHHHPAHCHHHHHHVVCWR